MFVFIFSTTRKRHSTQEYPINFPYLFPCRLYPILVIFSPSEGNISDLKSDGPCSGQRSKHTTSGIEMKSLKSE